ncbi:MAG TPA: PLP-dependent transferase, partial [Cytophagaceae bacterium]
DIHPNIKKVYYPGLPKHPHHAVARKQMKGYGGMLSFELDCDEMMLLKFLSGLRIIQPALSLGGVESLISVPAATSHSGLTKEQRTEMGISDTLVRLSVGIEDCDDLIEDLSNALKVISDHKVSI